MKRDMDLVRKILFAVEQSSGTVELKAEQLGCTQATLIDHLVILDEGGLIKARTFDDFRAEHLRAVAHRLTWQGHEFLDNMRDDTIWERTKEKAGEASFNVFMAVATALLLARMGLS